MSESVKKCPYCGEEISAVARKCKHCGKWLPKEEKKQCEELQTNSYFNETGSKECPFCCQKVPLHAKKCPHCGEWIEKKENKAVGCLTESVMGCCGVIILILFVFGILFLAAGDSGIYLAMIAFYFLVGIVGLFLYFVPTVIANKNKNHHTLIIFVINLFLGWSVLAWIACLIWVLSDNN